MLVPTAAGLAGFAVAVLIFVAGVAALIVAFVRRRSQDRTMRWFGLFAAIYGIRQFAKDPLIQATLGDPETVLRYFVAWMDYAIAVPTMLFSEEVLAKGWRPSIRWAVWVTVAYGVIGILLGLVTGDVYAIPEPGAGLLWCLWGAIAIIGISKKNRILAIPDAPLFAVGALVFIGFVLHDHYPSAGQRIEPLGLFIFICCLGAIAVRRTLRNEQKLLLAEQEMEAARRIQTSILPSHPPKVAGINVAARYLPMAAVAGDFYDFVVLDSGLLGVLVADVEGHGVPAALISSMVKVAFAFLHGIADDPSAVLSGLNRTFCAQRTGQYITAGYLVIDTLNHSVTHAGAGHPPLIVCHGSDRSVRRYEDNGILLGFRAPGNYPNVTLAISPGDRLLLYTDGLLDAANSKGEAFESQIEQRILCHADLPAERFADALLSDLSAWRAPTGGYAQEDDITLLVIDIGLPG